MKKIQTLFGEITEITKTNKETIRTYKQRLKDHIDYDCHKNKAAEFRDKMRRIEESIADELGLEMSLVRNEISMRKEMMSDIAISQLMDEGKIELVTDEYENTYEPVIKVSFKKVKK
ncbi:TPA: hypothetical protein DIC62_01470 [Candidatus Nomurabacteria bacterium]|nr:hypothetical protein [Candidatus Nomurabacteria bacterium]